MSESQSQSEVPSMDLYMASLRGAISEYESGKSIRSAQAVKLQLAQELIKQEAWDDALRILRPLWHTMSWRREGWWDLTEEVGTILREVAVKAGDGGTVVAVDWELMSSSRFIIGLHISGRDTNSYQLSHGTHARLSTLPSPLTTWTQ